MCYVIIERVFRDDLVLCTQEGCAKEPEEKGDFYKGLVKPGTFIVHLHPSFIWEIPGWGYLLGIEV